MSGMAPFITFTENSGEQDQREHLVNADHIVEALYLHQCGDLQITLRDSGGKVGNTLKGQEAAAALKILRSLKK
jgi:hypothetical protein